MSTLHSQATVGVADSRLQQLLHDHWEHTMQAQPVWATQLGDHRFDHDLGDPSPEAITRGFDHLRQLQARAEAIPPDSLNEADALTLAVFREMIRGELALEPCRFPEWSVTPARNIVADLSSTIEDHPIRSAESFASLHDRMAQMPAHIDAEMARLEHGRTEGLVAGAESLRRTLEFIDRTLALPTEESPLYAPGREPVPGMEDALRADLAQQHATGVQDVLLPKLMQYRDFLETTLLPAARGPDAATLTGLPAISGCYTQLLRRHTTLDRTPEEIHAIGLAHIERIHAEFLALAPRVFGTTHPELTQDISALFAHLRTAPELRFSTADTVLTTAEESLRAAEAAVPAVFHHLPATPCSVEPIPANIAPYTYVAWYEPPTESTDGIYRVNTYAPDTRLRHEARALAFHESVPGHHLQIALARELPDTPLFRRHMGLTAYVEGWALYSERLSDELGLYPSDLDRLGMLSYDAWRSARLVVDTGLHHLGWTRAEAEAWMVANTPLAENNIRNEVDRYIGWPGQATGYKLGQIELLKLREESQSALGEAFSLADFHSVVLEAGPVPLEVLADRVHRWVAAGGGRPVTPLSSPPGTAQ